MAEIIPEDIKEDLAKAISLHQRATSDYAQCEQFSKLMSSLLSRLEDAGCYNAADKVMGILLECNPKSGSNCEKSSQVANLTQKLEKYRR
jgi:formate dehydrogenase assembly factor FdhD